MLSNNKLSFEIIRTGVAILVALVFVVVIILFVSEVPLEALQYFLFGALTSFRRFGNVIEMTIPLIFVGLGLSIIFQSNEFNISSSGVFVIGAVVTSLIAIFIPLPPGVSIVVCLLGGGLAGAFFTLIPGFFKVKWNANELVTSLMLNYVLYQLASYIISTYARDMDVGLIVSLKLQKNTLLPNIFPGTRVHAGLVVAVALVVIMYFFLYKSKWGYTIRATGLNAKFAQYSGICTTKAVLLAQAIGGAIIGLGGGVEILGMYQRYKWQVIPTVGFDGIIVALIAKNNPAFIPVAAFLLAYIRIGADIMSRNTDIPSEVVLMLQAVIILFVVAEKFLSKWRYKQLLKANCITKELLT